MEKKNKKQKGRGAEVTSQVAKLIGTAGTNDEFFEVINRGVDPGLITGRPWRDRGDLQVLRDEKAWSGEWLL